MGRCYARPRRLPACSEASSVLKTGGVSKEPPGRCWNRVCHAWLALLRGKDVPSVHRSDGFGSITCKCAPKNPVATCHPHHNERLHGKERGIYSAVATFVVLLRNKLVTSQKLGRRGCGATEFRTVNETSKSWKD